MYLYLVLVLSTPSTSYRRIKCKYGFSQSFSVFAKDNVLTFKTYIHTYISNPFAIQLQIISTYATGYIFGCCEGNERLTLYLQLRICWIIHSEALHLSAVPRLHYKLRSLAMPQVLITTSIVFIISKSTQLTYILMTHTLTHTDTRTHDVRRSGRFCARLLNFPFLCSRFKF